MLDFTPFAADLGWPIAIALAWMIGELAHRWARLPRISVYGLVGFALGHGQLGLLPPAGDGPMTLLANIAFGLILFEFGYRINLRWLRVNPWIALTGVLESIATFAAIYWLTKLWGLPMLTSLLLSALGTLTSPAGVLRVANEQRSSGQVTERTLHLSAINCVLAVFAFHTIVGFWAYQTSGDLLHALSASGWLVVASGLLGAAFGFLVPAVLRVLGSPGRDATVGIGLSVVLLVALAHALKLSPMLATLALGITSRHRRMMLGQAQRNFGPLGDLLAVVLYVFIAATIEWPRVLTGVALAIPLIATRSLAKVLVVGALARPSGTTWRKGVFTGLALTPISAFVILLLTQTQMLGIDLVDQVAVLAATTLLLELIGPVVTHWALIWAQEAPEPGER